MSAASSLRYQVIGSGYARTRREDPRVAALIDHALGGARSVVNVGAGTGSYEPRSRHVIAIEPSDVMASQRPSGLAPAITATAGQLPLRDDSVDAAMAVLTIHHWDAEQKRGIRELSRVARDTVVIVTYDPEVHGSMWLMADYLPEVANLDMRICPRPEEIVAWLGGDAEVQTIETTRDTPDWALGSFWAHPERVLDAQARQATSGFARMDQAVVNRVVNAISGDLRSGAWDRRHGHLREIAALDVGLRLIVAHPG